MVTDRAGLIANRTAWHATVASGLTVWTAGECAQLASEMARGREVGSGLASGRWVGVGGR